MAATQKQLNFITNKIESIEQEKNALYQAVEGYVQHVTSTARVWVSSKGANGQHFRDINRVLGDVVAFLFEKAEEIDAGTGAERRDTEEFMKPQAEAVLEPTTTIALATPMSSSTSPSTPSSPSHAARSSSLLSDHLLLKLQERMELVETEMSNMSDKMDELAEVKTGMEDVGKKVKKCEETNTKTQGKLTTLKTRFEGFLEQFNTSTKEYNTNRGKDNKWFQKFEDKIGGLNQDIHLLSGDVKEVEKRVQKSEQRFSEVGAEVMNTEDRLSDVEKEKKEAGTNIRTLEEKLETCERKHEKVEELDDRIRCIEDERKNKDSERLNKIEERLQCLEEERIGVEIQRVGILEDKLLGMEEERRNDRKLDSIQTDISGVLTSMDVVEKKQQHKPVGFSAYLLQYRATNISAGPIIKEFSEVVTNSGNSYDQSTGIFTAPVDGLYVATVTHRQQNDRGARQLKVCHERVNPSVGGDKEVLVCQSLTERRSLASSTGVGVVYMTAGDRLYVKGGDYVGQIFWPAAFSCFLIG